MLRAGKAAIARIWLGDTHRVGLISCLNVLEDA
jgi:hypothetical protein